MITRTYSDNIEEPPLTFGKLILRASPQTGKFPCSISSKRETQIVGNDDQALASAGSSHLDLLRDFDFAFYTRDKTRIPSHLPRTTTSQPPPSPSCMPWSSSAGQSFLSSSPPRTDYPTSNYPKPRYTSAEPTFLAIARDQTYNSTTKCGRKFADSICKKIAKAWGCTEIRIHAYQHTWTGSDGEKDDEHITAKFRWEEGLEWPLHIYTQHTPKKLPRYNTDEYMQKEEDAKKSWADIQKEEDERKEREELAGWSVTCARWGRGSYNQRDESKGGEGIARQLSIETKYGTTKGYNKVMEKKSWRKN